MGFFYGFKIPALQNLNPVPTPIAISQKGFEGVWELWKVDNHWMIVFQRKAHCNTRVLSYWVNIFLLFN